MEGAENNNQEGLPEVKPRGEVEYVDRKGMMHYFETEKERAEFIEEESNPDNR